jgi:hypothetical protein
VLGASPPLLTSPAFSHSRLLSPSPAFMNGKGEAMEEEEEKDQVEEEEEDEGLGLFLPEPSATDGGLPATAAELLDALMDGVSEGLPAAEGLAIITCLLTCLLSCCLRVIGAIVAQQLSGQVRSSAGVLHVRAGLRVPVFRSAGDWFSHPQGPRTYEGREGGWQDLPVRACSYHMLRIPLSRCELLVSAAHTAAKCRGPASRSSAWAHARTSAAARSW